MSFATVARIWQDLQPWQIETSEFSTDPELVAKVRDVVGLHEQSPQNAIVVCLEEQTQVQALDRTAAILPRCPAIPRTQTHD